MHDYRVSYIKEIPILGKYTVLAYKKRRYHCDCCNKHFYEPFSLVPKHCRTTKRLAWHCISFLADKFSVTSAAKRNGVSPSYIFRRMKDIHFTIPNRLPQVLSIDEFRGNAGGQKFQGILTDPVAHKVFDILQDSKLALEVMLSQSNELAVAYHLKEKFYEFLDSADRSEAIKRLHFFILAAQTSQLKEFMPVLTMLGNWTKYILNSFDCPYTNGFTEGTNNVIKVIKRNAFGYRNFENFRSRILLALT